MSREVRSLTIVPARGPLIRLQYEHEDESGLRRSAGWDGKSKKKKKKKKRKKKKRSVSKKGVAILVTYS